MFLGAYVRFLSHQCALESMSYDSFLFCHGRGRGFEPRRPRQILKDLSPIWHVTLRYKKVQVQVSPFLLGPKWLSEKGSRLGAFSRLERTARVCQFSRRQVPPLHIALGISFAVRPCPNRLSSDGLQLCHKCGFVQRPSQR